MAARHLVLHLGHEGLHALQIAQPLFAGVGGEVEIARRREPGGVHGLHHGQQSGDGHAVVSDAGGQQARPLPLDLDVGPLRKHRVQVGRHGQPRTPARPRPSPAGVAGRIDGDVLEPEFGEPAPHIGGALRFLEGWGGDLADPDRLLRHLGGVSLDPGQGSSHGRVPHQSGHYPLTLPPFAGSRSVLRIRSHGTALHQHEHDGGHQHGTAFRLAISKGFTPAKPAAMMQAAATGDMLRPSAPPTHWPCSPG